MRESKIIKEIMCIRERQAVAETEIKGIKKDVGEVKAFIIRLDEKITKNILNNKVSSWVSRIISISIVGALITKLFSLW